MKNLILNPGQNLSMGGQSLPDESWIAGHLYYHKGLDPVVLDFVYPLIVSLVRNGSVDAFFFVRYGLGGPHIRLRLRAVPDAGEQVIAAMQQSARQFLDLYPSTQPMDEEAIRHLTASLLAGDQNETDDSVYPDNTFRLAPFRPEVERYGGPDLFRASLDFFALSSVAVIEVLAKHRDLARSAQLVRVFRLLLQQALGFAADEAELFDLLRYGVDTWGKFLPKVIEKGDKVATDNLEAFCQIVRDVMQGALSLSTGDGLPVSTADFLTAGATRLSTAIGNGDRALRARIGGSQLHMTATRFGLSNAEEVYISRLLTVALQKVRADGVEDLSWLDGRPARGAADLPMALDDLLGPAMAALADLPAV